MICRSKSGPPELGPDHPQIPDSHVPPFPIWPENGEGLPVSRLRVGRIGNRGPEAAGREFAGPGLAGSQFSLGETRPAESGLTSGHRSCARLGRMGFQCRRLPGPSGSQRRTWQALGEDSPLRTNTEQFNSSTVQHLKKLHNSSRAQQFTNLLGGDPHRFQKGLLSHRNRNTGRTGTLEVCMPLASLCAQSHPLGG